MKLKKIGVLSAAKIGMLFGILLGLIGGISMSILSTSPEFVQAAELAPMANIAVKLGYFSILVFPVLYAIIYFIAAAITALLYNLFAKWIGGIELELK